MSKTYICLPLNGNIGLKDIQALVQECECNVKVVDGASVSVALLVNFDGLIVLLGQGLHELNEIELAVSHANKLGKQIFGLWLPNPQSDVVPQGLEKYGAALLPWDASKICAAICDDKLEWEDAAGGVRATPKTKRHKC